MLTLFHRFCKGKIQDARCGLKAIGYRQEAGFKRPSSLSSRVRPPGQIEGSDIEIPRLTAFARNDKLSMLDAGC